MRKRTLVVALLGLAPAVAAAEPAWGQIRQLDRELVFTPVTPCRVFDSRSFQPLRPGEVRHVFFNTQCGVSGAVAVVLNMVAVGPAGPGHLTAWPVGRPKPLASVINYNPGVTIANGLVLEICPLCPPSGYELSFEAAVSATHLVVDVAGYFAPRVRPGASRYGAGEGTDRFPCINSGQGVKFGLSHIVADWLNADLACGPGTWVCSPEERGSGACNTTRPDGTCDLVGDNGSCWDLASDAHRGWTRPRNDTLWAVATATGTAVDEMGASTSYRYGSHLPVWCCSPF